MAQTGYRARCENRNWLKLEILFHQGKVVSKKTMWSIARAGDILVGVLRMTVDCHSQRTRQNVPLLTNQMSQKENAQTNPLKTD